MQRLQLDELTRVLFTRRDGQLATISFVELIILPDILGGRPAAYIHSMWTDESHRHKGLAIDLLKEAQDFAKTAGCHKVFVNCNTDLVAFYTRSGFENDGNVMVKRF